MQIWSSSSSRWPTSSRRIQRIRFRRLTRRATAIWLVVSVYFLGSFIIPKSGDHPLHPVKLIDDNPPEFPLQVQPPDSAKRDPLEEDLFSQYFLDNETDRLGIFDEKGELIPLDGEIQEGDSKTLSFRSRIVDPVEIDPLFFYQGRKESEPSSENLPVKTILFYTDDHSGGKR